MAIKPTVVEIFGKKPEITVVSRSESTKKQTSLLLVFSWDLLTMRQTWNSARLALKMCHSGKIQRRLYHAIYLLILTTRISDSAFKFSKTACFFPLRPSSASLKCPSTCCIWPWGRAVCFDFAWWEHSLSQDTTAIDWSSQATPLFFLSHANTVAMTWNLLLS